MDEGKPYKRILESGDGWTWYEMPDGSLVDNLDPDLVDIQWDSVKQFNDTDPGIGIWEKGDDVGKYRAIGGDDWDWDKLAKEMSSQRLEKEAQDALNKAAKLNKQNALANRMRKVGMTVVKKGAPKIAALMGGPLGWAIGAGSTALDVADAYAITRDTLDPKDAGDFARQKAIADLMRKDAAATGE